MNKICKIHGYTPHYHSKKDNRFRCKLCLKKYAKKQNESKVIQREKFKKELVDYMGGSCIKCGYSKSTMALDFHHKNPNEKDFLISKPQNIANKKLIYKEVDKCILLCCNCHREEHNSIEKRKVNLNRTQKWRINTKRKMVKSMGDSCQICKNKYEDFQYDFHHINPEEKEFNFGFALRNPKSWEKISNELKKSILLCGNCHREVHEEISKIPKEYSKFKEPEFIEVNKKIIKKRIFKEKTEDKCPVCQKLKDSSLKSCSTKYANIASRKVDWDNINLPQLIKDFPNAEQIGKHLGVSGAAVRKQIKKREL